MQHCFEDAQWARQSAWEASHAPLRDSSYLKLPRGPQWFAGNIGFYYIHHLMARIPSYRVQECDEGNTDLLGSVTVLSLREVLVAPSYALWGEDRGRMLQFKDVHP